MRVRLDPDHAVPALRSMPPAMRTRMRKALRSLQDDPSGTSTGLDVKRLRTPGDPPAFRLRLGDWRACWLLRGNTIDVVRVFHRREGYAWLDRLYP